MNVVILAGGRGTRFAEETDIRPKPMIEIGGMPILLHVMKIYGKHGLTNFIIASGYKNWMIKDYFQNFVLHNSDLEVDLGGGSHQTTRKVEGYDWRVTVVDTGLDTPTAGRLLRLKKYLGDDPFFLTYGDGVSDVDIPQLLDVHREQGRLATVTAVHPPARFGRLTLDGKRVNQFVEKPQVDRGWINGGFFVFEPGVFKYLGEDVNLEREPLERLAAEDQLTAYSHEGFWLPMDTLRDKLLLENLWSSGQAPWS